MRVGTVVRAKRECGPVARIDEIGVCYEIYHLAGRPGASIIFERGGYDGFSPEESALFLERLVHCKRVGGYRFKNVFLLYADYKAGVFDECWDLGR